MSEEIKRDKWYKSNHLSFEEKVQITKDAKKICYKWYVNKLDVSINWSSKAIKMRYATIMKKYASSSHFVLVHRRGYNRPFHLEIGWSTIDSGPRYMLWVLIEQGRIEKFLKEHKLEFQGYG